MKTKGSLTVFAAISFMLIAQFLFVVIEAARYSQINKVTEIQTRSALESVFAEYCIPLWDEYHLLGADLEEKDLKDEFQIISDLDYYGKMNLVRANISDINVAGYQVLTDAKGAVYEAQVSKFMQSRVGYSTIKKIYDEFSALEHMTNSKEYSDTSVEDAIDVISQKDADSSGGQSAVVSDDTTLEDVAKIKKKGILSLVLDSNAQKKLSAKQINTKTVVSSRKLSTGKGLKAPTEEWMDKVLLELYMEENMSTYLKPKSGRALKYEYEYLLAGKSTDVENLKSVVNQIIAVREAANYLYIISDSVKMQETSALATAIGGATLNPVAIAVIQAGLIAAWAYCESILDARALLAGDKIPFIKSSRTWTSDLEHITSLLNGHGKAKSDKSGVGYSTYLGFLYMTKTRQTRAYRAMDIQELYVNSVKGYENVRMDGFVCKSEVEAKYLYDFIFVDFVKLLKSRDHGILLKKKASYGYY